MAHLGDLQEIILHVEDFSTQLAFYRDRLGLKVVTSSDGPEARVVFSTGACRLALDASLKPGPAANRVRLVFTTQDLESARAGLVANGVRLSPIYLNDQGLSQCDGSDPEGNLFALQSGGLTSKAATATGGNVPHTSSRRVWAV